MPSDGDMMLACECAAMGKSAWVGGGVDSIHSRGRTRTSLSMDGRGGATECPTVLLLIRSATRPRSSGSWAVKTNFDSGGRAGDGSEESFVPASAEREVGRVRSVLAWLVRLDLRPTQPRYSAQFCSLVSCIRAVPSRQFAFCAPRMSCFVLGAIWRPIGSRPSAIWRFQFPLRFNSTMRTVSSHRFISSNKPCLTQLLVIDPFL